MLKLFASLCKLSLAGNQKLLSFTLEEKVLTKKFPMEKPQVGIVSKFCKLDEKLE